MHAVVDVPVDHEPAPRLRIAEHRVVAERQDTPVDFNFLQRLDALEIIPEPHALRPGMVVVSQDQMLSPGEGLQDRFGGCAPEEQVAEDMDLVSGFDLRVPPFEQNRVHLLQRTERPLAEPDDVEVPEMLV